MSLKLVSVMHTKCHTQSERAFIICTQSEQGNREKKVVHGSMHTCTHNETKDRMPVFSLAHEMHGKKKWGIRVVSYLISIMKKKNEDVNIIMMMMKMNHLMRQALDSTST